MGNHDNLAAGIPGSFDKKERKQIYLSKSYNKGDDGVFFFDVGGAALKGQPFKFATSKDEIVDTIAGFQFDPITGGFVPVPGDPKAISGFRLKDGRASYGVGLETFALGFPIHFDWSWRTLFNKDYEDYLFAIDGGSGNFRHPKFAVWIGYDF